MSGYPGSNGRVTGGHRRGHAAERPPRLVFLYASPLVQRVLGGRVEEIPTLDTSTEQDLLRETLELAQRRVVLSVDVASANNLRTRATLGCRALHYTGHGLESCLAFEDGKGAMHSLEPEPLRKLFGAGGGVEGIQFVFVSACHSQSAGEAFVRAGVPHVVACRWDSKVSDHDSLVFSRNFYLALLVGKTLKAAFDIGAAAVEAAPHPGSGDGGLGASSVKFMLLPEWQDHNVAIFGDAERGAYMDETPEPAPNTCDAVPTYFIGRNAHVQAVVEALADRARLVTVRGEAGVGKTSVALRACEYMGERRMFPDGIFFVRVHDDDGASDASSDMGGGGGGGADGGGLSTPMTCDSGDCIAARVARELVRGGCLSREDLGGADFDAMVAEAAVGSPKAVASCEDTLAIVLERKRVLIVLDGVDSSDFDRSNARSFLAGFLRRTRQPAVVMTAEHAVGADSIGGAEKVVDVGPLMDIHVAAMFAALAPRKLTLVEMNGAPDIARALQCFAQSPVITRLKGHPKAVTMVVPLLQNPEVTMEGLAEMVPDILERARAPPAIRRTMSRDVSGAVVAGLDAKDDPGAGDGKRDGGFAADKGGGRGTESDSKSGGSGAAPPGNSGDLLDQIMMRDAHLLPDAVGRRVWVSVSRLLHASKAQSEGKAAGEDTGGAAVPSHNTGTVHTHMLGHGRVASTLSGSGGTVDEVPWDVLCGALQQHFVERVPAPASRRALSISDMEFLRVRCFACNGIDPFTAGPNALVTFEMFAEFWKWLGPVLVLIVRLHKLWGSVSPVRLHGFLDKTQAFNMLLGDESAGPGTFLLRFSERHAGCLAIAFVVEVPAAVEDPEAAALGNNGGGRAAATVLDVRHSLLVPLHPQGFRVYFEVGEMRPNTVTEFVGLSDYLLYLYPRVPKTDLLAFGDPANELTNVSDGAKGGGVEPRKQKTLDEDDDDDDVGRGGGQASDGKDGRDGAALLKVETPAHARHGGHDDENRRDGGGGDGRGGGAAGLPQQEFGPA